MRFELDDGLYRYYLRDVQAGDAIGEFIVFDGELFYTGRIDKRIQILIPPGEVLATTACFISAAHFDRLNFLKVIFFPENDSLPSS